MTEGKPKIEAVDVKTKLSNAVSNCGWDAVVVLGVENVQYWSGAWMPYARGYLDRPSVVIWPKNDGGTLITAGELLDGVRPLSFLSSFVGYEEKGALPPAVIVETVADVLKAAGLADGQIGLEMLRTSVLFFDRLRELMPKAVFESADEFLRRLRMVKTAPEIELMKEGARLSDDGVAKGFEVSRAGDSEEEVARNIKIKVAENGPTLEAAILVGTGEGARLIASPSDRKLARGDIVRVDINAVYNGYYADLGRMAVVGDPNSDQAKAYEEHVEFKRRIFDFMRPGVRCNEVHRFYLEEAERMGAELFIYPYIGLGHGIGVNGDEYPKLNAADSTILEAGMILNVEADTLGPEGEVFHAEDMVLVTADGVTPITWSRDWSELPRIAV